MHPRDYYLNEARDLLKKAREEKQITNAQLAQMLKAHGAHVETQVLINKINRGRFTLQFAFQCLAAMDVKTVQVPNYLEYKLKVDKRLNSTQINHPNFEMPELTDDDDAHR